MLLLIGFIMNLCIIGVLRYWALIHLEGLLMLIQIKMD